MSVYSSLNTAYTGIKTSQLMVETTSNNVSNANNEYYTRQKVALTSSKVPLTGLNVGQGAQAESIIRIHNSFVYERYRKAEMDMESSDTEQRVLQEVSSYFADIDGVGIFNDMENYFTAWQNLAANPNESAHKISLSKYADTLTRNLNLLYTKIDNLQGSLNNQIEAAVDEFNRMGSKIVELNKQINTEKGGISSANDMKDEREKYELAMSKLINIDLHKSSFNSNAPASMDMSELDETYNITLKGRSLINYEDFKDLKLSNDDISSGLFNIEYGATDDDITDSITGGKIGALLKLRGGFVDKNTGKPTDGVLQEYLNNINSFTKALIENTNNIYAQSASSKLTGDVLESSDGSIVADTTRLVNTSLNINTTKDTVLNKQPSFFVNIYDNEGKLVSSKEVELSESSTFQSIVSRINEDEDSNADNDFTNDVDDYFEASFSGGALRIEPNSIATNKNYTVAIEDSKDVPTNFAGALGMNRFFNGYNAEDIEVNIELLNEPLDINPFSSPVEGNNTVANAMLQMQYEKLEFYRSNDVKFSEDQTLEDFYKMMAANIAADTDNSVIQKDTKESIFNTIKFEFDNISKVSIDEELANLLKFQSAYQASAKVVTIVDQMIDALLGMKK